MHDAMMDTDLPHQGLDFGLPQDRAARMAARRAFVDMKQLFMKAVEPLVHAKGLWLQEQVRQAHEPIHLWLLRGPLLAAIKEDGRSPRALRAELYKGLDMVFPEAFGFDHSLTPLNMPQPWEIAQAQSAGASNKLYV